MITANMYIVSVIFDTNERKNLRRSDKTERKGNRISTPQASDAGQNHQKGGFLHLGRVDLSG